MILPANIGTNTTNIKNTITTNHNNNKNDVCVIDLQNSDRDLWHPKINPNDTDINLKPLKSQSPKNSLFESYNNNNNNSFRNVQRIDLRESVSSNETEDLYLKKLTARIDEELIKDEKAIADLLNETPGMVQQTQYNHNKQTQQKESYIDTQKQQHSLILSPSSKSYNQNTQNNIILNDDDNNNDAYFEYHANNNNNNNNNSQILKNNTNHKITKDTHFINSSVMDDYDDIDEPRFDRFPSGFMHIHVSLFVLISFLNKTDCFFAQAFFLARFV